MSYLLDTTPLTALLRGRAAVMAIFAPWIANREVVTTLLSVGEVLEYLKGFADYPRHSNELQNVLKEVTPIGLDRSIVEWYADRRRALRPPFGPGLIGDIDTLIAATALDRNLPLVTSDRHFQRVPGLKLMPLPRF